MGPRKHKRRAKRRVAYVDDTYGVPVATARRSPPRYGSAACGESETGVRGGLAAINGALEAMIPALAVELRPLRINAVPPGVIDIPWWHGLPEPDRRALFARYGAASLVGRIGAPEEVVQLIMAVVGNSFTTSTVMTVDGGLRFSAAA